MFDLEFASDGASMGRYCGMTSANGKLLAHNSNMRQAEGITPLYVRRSVYLAFFGGLTFEETRSEPLNFNNINEEQRPAEERAAEERAAEERAAEERAAEQRAAEERAAEERGADEFPNNGDPTAPSIIASSYYSTDDGQLQVCFQLGEFVTG